MENLKRRNLLLGTLQHNTQNVYNCFHRAVLWRREHTGSSCRVQIRSLHISKGIQRISAGGGHHQHQHQLLHQHVSERETYLLRKDLTSKSNSSFLLSNEKKLFPGLSFKLPKLFLLPTKASLNLRRKEKQSFTPFFCNCTTATKTCSYLRRFRNFPLFYKKYLRS